MGKMQYPNSQLIIAAAGSGKTETLVNMAIKEKRRMVITTYTDENVEEIKSRLYMRNGCIPGNVTIMPWYTFLLTHGVKPYQDACYTKDIKGVCLTGGASTTRIAQNNIRYFFASDGRIYADKIACFLLLLNKHLEGVVINSLRELFPVIYIDETQDMAGHDQEMIMALIKNGIEVTCVCDPRQSVFTTSRGVKNKKYKCDGIIDYFVDKLPTVKRDDTLLNTNYRCVDVICKLSDRLYPSLVPVVSANKKSASRIGCYFVRKRDVVRFLEEAATIQLRHSVRIPICTNHPVFNFGGVKGKSYDHVLIYPTAEMTNWLMTGIDNLKPETKAKLYVAITRARFSVGFVIDYPDELEHDLILKYNYEE